MLPNLGTLSLSRPSAPTAGFEELEREEVEEYGKYDPGDFEQEDDKQILDPLSGEPLRTQKAKGEVDATFCIERHDREGKQRCRWYRAEGLAKYAAAWMAGGKWPTEPNSYTPLTLKDVEELREAYPKFFEEAGVDPPPARLMPNSVFPAPTAEERDEWAMMQRYVDSTADDIAVLMDRVPAATKQDFSSFITQRLSRNASFPAHGGQTFLFMVIKKPNLDWMIKELVEQGWDPNHECMLFGGTNPLLTRPMHEAAKYFNARAIRALASAGANINHRIESGRRRLTPLECLFRQTPRSAMDDTWKRNSMEAIRYELANKKYNETAQALLEARADPNTPHPNKSTTDISEIPNMHKHLQTPLMLAVQNRADLDCVNLLLKHGADPTALDIDRRNVLHILAAHNRTDPILGDDEDMDVAIVQRLLEAGASPLVTDRFGDTALDVAERRVFSSQTGTVWEKGYLAVANAMRAHLGEPKIDEGAEKKVVDARSGLVRMKYRAAADAERDRVFGPLSGLVGGRWRR